MPPNIPTHYAHHDGSSLLIGNRWVERAFSARVGEPFITSSFVNKTSNRDYVRTDRDYARAGSREFCFSIDGNEITGNDFALERIEIHDERDPIEIVAHLQTKELKENSQSSPSSLISLDLHFLIYSDHPVIRKWLVIENRGDQTIHVTDLDWEDLQLLVDSAASAEVWSDYFTRRNKSIIVTMDDCALLVNDTLHHEGFILATEAPGPLKRMNVYGQPGRIAIGLNRDDETIFERVLAPGEKFQTPASFILPFAHPIPQDVIEHEYAHFVEKYLTVCDVAQVPTISLNTWVPFLSHLDSDLVLKQINLAAELGVDAYQIDDGWYDRLGDWNTNDLKFPNGMEEIAEHCHARGMRFGLWMTVAAVDEASGVAREHPEWIARDRNGQPNRHPAPGTITMCLDSSYFDFILDKIDSVINRYGVELLKLDFSSVRNVYEPGRYPGCFATNHTHPSANDSHLRIVERLFDLIRAIKQRHPRCLIDVTYELYGVMDGTDLALIQVADQNWFTNITSPNEVNFRREVYQRGRVTRPWTLNFGGTVLEHPNAKTYGIFSAFAAHGLFWGDLESLDEDLRQHYKRWFAWAKEQRAHSDFYRYYQCSDIFPVPDGVSSRDYRHMIPAARFGTRPLGIHPPAFDPSSQHPGEFWDGVARLDERGEGPIFVFRPGASFSPYFQLRIPWVNRDTHYHVTNATRNTDVGTFTGAALSDQGIELHIAQPLDALVIVLRQVDNMTG
ncbi:MAG: alpha-galactosidase [Chloroflexi bacterium]|nr:alpha-galactosidase [Chloroflexota bacterium]